MQSQESLSFFCHTCDERIDSATLLESGEYLCSQCDEPYVEILEPEDDFEQEMQMVICDYDSDDDEEMEENEEIPLAREPQPYHMSFEHVRRTPEPYSFVPNPRSVPPRDPQPYSMTFQTFTTRRSRPRRAEPQRPRQQPQPQTSFFFGQSFFDFPGQAGMPQRNPNQPNQFFDQAFQQFFGNAFGNAFQSRRTSNFNMGDFFHGNFNDLLARHFQRHQEDSGKPPASKSDIEALHTETLTEESCKHHAEHPCAVCQDHLNANEEICTLACGHTFHKDCVVPWLELHRTCPLCRHEVGSPAPPQQRAAEAL